MPMTSSIINAINYVVFAGTHTPITWSFCFLQHSPIEVLGAAHIKVCLLHDRSLRCFYIPICYLYTIANTHAQPFFSPSYHINIFKCAFQITVKQFLKKKERKRKCLSSVL